MAAININHNEGSITTDNDKVLQITDNGGVKIGNGNYLDELENPQSGVIRADYEGVIRYNSNKGTIQYCDGTAWKDFSYNANETPGIIWAITF
jgi:hypothetical protein